MQLFNRGSSLNLNTEDSQTRLRRIRDKAQDLLAEIQDSPSGFVNNHDLGILHAELTDSIEDISQQLGE